jgi:hypothetical protein
MRRLIFLIGLIFSATLAHATAPTISSLAGTLSGDADSTSANVVTITGANFGTKATAAPQIWFTAEGSTNPTTLGTTATWDEYLGWNGTTTTVHLGGSRSLYITMGSVNTTGSLQTNYSGFVRGSKMFCYTGRYVTYGVEATNQKWHRWWASGATYPNFYNGTSGVEAGSLLRVLEIVPDTTISTYINDVVNPPGQSQNTWRYEETLLQNNSANNVADGIFTIRVGTMSSTTTTMKTDSTNANGLLIKDNILEANFNSPAISASYVYIDDVYMDKYFARIMLGDAATYAGSSKRTPLIPKTWSDTSVTAYFHQGNWSNGATAYVYVCNDSNECNATGYSVTLATTYADPSTITTISGSGRIGGAGLSMHR